MICTVAQYKEVKIIREQDALCFDFLLRQKNGMLCIALHKQDIIDLKDVLYFDAEGT